MLGPIEDEVVVIVTWKWERYQQTQHASGECERVQGWMDSYATSHFQTSPSFCLFGGSWFPLIWSSRFANTLAHLSIPCTLPSIWILVVYIRSAFAAHWRTSDLACDTRMSCPLSALCSGLQETLRRFVMKALECLPCRVSADILEFGRGLAGRAHEVYVLGSSPGAS